MKNPKKKTKSSVSRETINSSIQNLLKSYDLPAKNATMLRLGIEEGLQIANGQKSGGDSGSSFHSFYSKGIVRDFLLFGILAYIVYKTVQKFPKGMSMFKSTTEKAIVSDVTFDDVCGIDEVKDEMKDIVEYLRDPEKFTKLGAKLPKGILFIGPPGTGKTLLAKAVAGEAGVPFFYASGSEFDELFVGVGALRIRQLFEKARAQSPAIIFIDEIDACGSKRSNSSRQPYARQTINQLLQEMDGFASKEHIIVMGATNTGEILDKALTRPGRFDQKVNIMLPDIKGRKDILNLYIGKLGSTSEVNVDRIASLTGGMSGADLNNLVNQAALRAAKNSKETVDQEDLEYALDKIRMGPELKTRIRTEKDLKNTAHHEAGHALVAYYTPAAQNIYKATIRQRGQALGHVSLMPSAEDEISQSKAQLLAMLDICMGGRIAEEILHGKEKVSTGASSDIQSATVTAYKLVCQYGMSDKLGLMTYDIDHLSQETKRVVEMEVKNVLETSYEKARKLLTTRSNEHVLLAEALIRYETLTMDEIKVLLESGDLQKIGTLRQKEERARLKKKLEKSIAIAAPVIDYVPAAPEQAEP
uniref:ATP-dependent zinc metalloprotease YME1L1 n=1 Tax=Phallusia mammillata TaxID=59560 RepID=A0A6F9DXD5_9ASCI|nr:ATP-dependent zinc metalloprotease YME1L1 [Phallusia mammillata]